MSMSKPVNSNSYTAGSINIRKLLKQLGKYDGSSYADLLLELIDNSFDADATKITIEINTEEKYIRIFDNGCGMDKKNLIRFTELYSDTLEEKSRTRDGRFGIGAKKACAVLSGLGKVELVTVFGDTKSKAIIDYQKAMKEKSGYQGCVTVEEEETAEETGTVIKINCRKYCVLEEIEEYYHSTDIRYNLKFLLSRTYTPRLKANEECQILLEFDGNGMEVPIYDFFLENDNRFIYQNTRIYLYKKGNNKRYNYAYARPNQDDPDEKYILGNKNTEIILTDDYKYQGIYFDLELCFPKETRIVSDRKVPGTKDDRRSEFVITSNSEYLKDISFCKYLRDNFNLYGEKRGKLNVDFTEFMEELRNIEVKRNNKILSSLPFEVKDIFRGTDPDEKAKYINIFKRISFNSLADDFLKLTQETKSRVSWDNSVYGLKKTILYFVDKFVKTQINKYFVNKINNKICIRSPPELYTPCPFHQCECSENSISDKDDSNGDVSNGDESDVDESDGDESDGDESDGDESDGDESDGDESDGDESDGNKSNGDESDGNESKGDESDREVDGGGTDGGGTDGGGTDGGGTDGGGTDGGGTDGGGTDGGGTDGGENEEYTPEISHSHIITEVYRNIIDFYKSKTLEDFDLEKAKLNPTTDEEMDAICEIAQILKKYSK